MDYFLLIASLLMLATTALHVFAGTREISHPVMGSDLHPIVRATNLVVWHFVSVFLALTSAGLYWVATTPNAALQVFLLACMVAFACVFLAVTLGLLKSLFALPQWTLFAVTSCLIGASLIF